MMDHSQAEDKEKDVPKQVELDTPADAHTTTQVVKRHADDLGNNQSTTRSPEALCRAVIFYVLYFIYIYFSCYIFTKVQLLWLLHSCGSSP